MHFTSVKLDNMFSSSELPLCHSILVLQGSKFNVIHGVITFVSLFASPWKFPLFSEKAKTYLWRICICIHKVFVLCSKWFKSKDVNMLWDGFTKSKCIMLYVAIMTK